MKKVIRSTILILVILIVVFLSAPMVMWSGSTQRPIHVTVRSSDGSLIREATVTLVQSMDERLMAHLTPEEFRTHLEKSQQHALTDHKGVAVLTGRFRAGGSSAMWFRHGRFGVNGDLTVSHGEFQTIAIPLINFTQERALSIRKKSLDFTVFMKRKPSESTGQTDGFSPASSD